RPESVSAEQARRLSAVPPADSGSGAGGGRFGRPAPQPRVSRRGARRCPRDRGNGARSARPSLARRAARVGRFRSSRRVVRYPPNDGTLPRHSCPHLRAWWLVPPDAPRVLLVIGAYHPEISAAGIQARAVASALAGRATFSVLATAVDPTLPPRDLVDGVPVYRARVDVRRRASRAAASIRVAAQFAAARDRFDLVHIHGISRKNVPVTTLARLFGKRILLHLHTAGQDEPAEAGRAGVLGAWSFRQAELVLPVSPLLMDRCLASGVDRSRLRYAPNGVDPQRFARSEEHTSELQSRFDLVCRLLLEKKKEPRCESCGPSLVHTSSTSS